MTKIIANNAVLHNFEYYGSTRDWALVTCAVAFAFHKNMGHMFAYSQCLYASPVK